MVEPSQTGVRACIKCGWLFVSQDRDRIRRCHDCKATEDEYAPRSGRVVGTGEVLRIAFCKDGST